MERRLFCQLSPTAYRISTLKCRMLRRLQDLAASQNFARELDINPLPVSIYRHRSLIRRRLGNSDMALQENKAVNLRLAAPNINGLLIRPGEVFSFWRLVGNPTARRGYREGLTIAGGQASSGIGGGMCQFTNLLHWMVLHTSMTITEHHHHHGVDLFPDFNRQIPFGTGTSILYNYLDYRFVNNTDLTYQLLVTTTQEHLCGEIRADRPQDLAYHIRSQGECFTREGQEVYRNGEVYRYAVDPVTGDQVACTLLRVNHARVLYDPAGLEIAEEVPAAPGP